MTLIDPNQALGAAMQAQLAALRDRTRARGSSSPSSPAASQAAAEAARAAAAQRIGAIAPDDPRRQQKAVRVFLESELAREFGDGVLNDPTFPRMLDDVQEQMQGDLQTAAAVLALGDVLLAGRLP
jgi:hypothetical protein